MSGFTDELSFIESNPQFAQLSYEDQIKTRSAVLNKYLPADPTFVSANNQTKQLLYDRLLYRRPIFENDHPELNQILPQVEQHKDPKLIRGILDNLLPGAILNELKLNPEQKAELKELNQLRYAYAINQVRKFTQSTVVGEGLWKGVNWMMDRLNVKDHPFTDAQRRDTDKLVKYMDFHMSKDKKLRNMLGPMALIGNVGGLAADLYIGYQATTGAAMAFGQGLTGGAGVFNALSQTKLIGQFNTAAKVTRFFGPAVAHAVGDGMIGVMRENLNDMWIKGVKDLTFQQTAENSLKYFTEYALGDIAFWAGGKLLKNFGKTAFRFIKGGFSVDAVKMGKVSDVLKDTLSLKEIDPVWFARQPKKVQEVLRQTQAVAKTLKNAGELSMDDMLRIYGAQRGFLVQSVEGGGKWKVSHILDDSMRPRYFTNPDNAATAMTKMMKNYTKTAVPSLLPEGTKIKNLKVEATIKGKMPELPEDQLKVLTKTIAPLGGKFTSEGVETFSKGFLKAGGASDDVLKTVKVAKEGTDLKVFIKDNEVMKIPEHVMNGGMEYQNIKGLTDELNKFIEKGAEFKGIYKTQIKEQALYTKSFIDDFVMEHGGTQIQKVDDGTFRTVVQGKEITGATYDEIGDQLLKSFASDDVELFRQYLYNHEGIKLVEQKGKYVLRKGSKNIDGPFENIEDIMNKHEDLIPRIPAEFGPKLTLVDDGSSIMYRQKILSGSSGEILDELNKFKSRNLSSTTFEFGDAQVKQIGREYHVSLDNLGLKETFSNLKDVKSFMSKELHEMISYAAPRKGFRMYTIGGDYYFVTNKAGKQIKYVAHNPEEAAALLANNNAMPEWAPELTGIDSQVMQNMKTIPGFSYKPETYMPQVNLSNMKSHQVFQTFFRAPDQMFNSLQRKGVMGAEIINKEFRNLESAREVIIGETQKLAPYVDDVFKFKNGKELKALHKEYVTQLGEIPRDQWDGWFKDHPKAPKELGEVVDNVRAFYGKHAEDGLFLYFGTDPALFLSEYMPHMRNKINSLDMRKYADADVHILLRDIFGDKIPQQIDAFFKHARVGDMVELVREMDAKVLLQKYITTGMRAKYLGPVIESTSKNILKNYNKIDDALLKYFGSYLTDIGGVPSGVGAKMGYEFTKRLFSNLGIKSQTLAKNFAESALGWAYLGTMGWRAYLPVRNSMQIWTTLASRMENGWVGTALEFLEKDKKGLVFKMLKERGIISQGLPIGGAEKVIEGAAGKFLKSGLHWYKNSDSFTRAVAYMTCKLRFDEAVGRFTKGIIDQKKFVQASGLFNLSDQAFDDAMKLIGKGQLDSAGDLFGREITMETMFPYRQGTNPLAFKGMIGKVFGQMGHYPVYWAENIARGVSRGNIGNKAAYIARFLGNTTAIGTTLGAMGISAANFTPWQPAMFSGGPWWDLLNDGIKLWSPGYEGRQARAKLLGLKEKDGMPYWDFNTFKKAPQWNVIIPGMLQWRSLGKAADYLNKGDFYKFVLSLASTPLKPE
jgi:hypothetical protein